MRGETRGEEQAEFGRHSENNLLSGCGGTRTLISKPDPAANKTMTEEESSMSLEPQFQNFVGI